MTHEGAHLFYLAFRLTLVFIIISYVTLCSTATETLHTDDVPLLGQDEETQQTCKEHLSTSPTLAAGMAYPAQPLPQTQHSEPLIEGGGTRFFPAPAQYSPYHAPPSGQQQSSNTNVVRMDPCSSGAFCSN